jgi:hypothetical protein
MIKPIVTLMLGLCGLAASAQPVYRCGSAYSQLPCPQAARFVDATDARSEEQRAAAMRVVADEKRLGAQMERDRLTAQAALKPAGAASLSAPPVKPVEHSSRAKKLKKPKKPRLQT